MSHDAWLVVDTGGPEPAVVADIGNYTRNVSPMWRKAMEAAAGKPMAIQDTEGWLAADALPLFVKALGHMYLHAEEYRAMNPTNGWGDYEGARDFVSKCAQACEEHPKATVRWSV